MHCICLIQFMCWDSIHIIVLNRVFLVISMCSTYALQMLIMMIVKDQWVHCISDNQIIKISLKVQKHFFCCQYVNICSECTRKKYAENVLEFSHKHVMMNDVDDIMLWWDWNYHILQKTEVKTAKLYPCNFHKLRLFVNSTIVGIVYSPSSRNAVMS